MQDKIQDIMGLVEDYGITASFGDSAELPNCRALIQSKLRELVRQPLKHEQAKAIAAKANDALHAVWLTERAHNITYTSN